MRISTDWAQLLAAEFDKAYFKELESFLEREYKEEIVYPVQEQIFHALELTSWAQTKVVLLGQDPYHGPGQAHGLSFSVPHGMVLPPSLRNIFHERKEDLGLALPQTGSLQAWAKQGVLLLNTCLTVRDGQAGSHRGRGWETFTDRILQLVNEKPEPVVYLLWGKDAQKKASLLTNPAHLLLKTAHPSPLAAYRGFFGSRPFSQANQFLIQQGAKPIDWQV